MVKTKVKFTLEQAKRAQRGSRGIALFFNFGATWERVVNAMQRTLYPRVKKPVPIVQEAPRAPEPAWTGAVNVTPIRIRSPDCRSPSD
jgi:hypothetical protein